MIRKYEWEKLRICRGRRPVGEKGAFTPAARGVNLPIIFATADDDPETRQKAQRIGAVAFFRKPVDGTVLFDAVEWVLPSNNGGGNREQSDASGDRATRVGRV